MPTITINIDDKPPQSRDPLDQFEGPQECCQGADGKDHEAIDHDYCAAVNLAQAAQYLRMALEHADDDEISQITIVAERLTAEYLAASG